MNLRKIILFVVFSFYFSLNNYSQTAIAPSGSGTSADPYLISSLGNLYWISTSLITNSTFSNGKFFLQTNDIDASATSSWTNKWIPIGGRNSILPSSGSDDENRVFQGTYNGAGFTIGGITYENNEPSNNLNGFFGSVSGTILNLKLTNLSITTNSAKTGGLVPLLTVGGIIYNCSTSGNILSTDANAGGLVGQNAGTIFNSYSNCNVTATSVAGGLLGLNQKNVYDCYSNGSVTTSLDGAYIGGLIAEFSVSPLFRSYANTSVTIASGTTTTYDGGLIGRLRKDMSNISGSNNYWNTDLYTIGKGTANTFSFFGTGLTSAQLKVQSNFGSNWDFVNTWGFGSDGYPTLVNKPNTWLGVNTNWSDTANWSLGIVPSSNTLSLPNSTTAFSAKDLVHIPADLANYPVLTADITTYSITLEDGALITSNGHTIISSFYFGQNNDWNGTTNTDWNTASNWSLGSVPIPANLVSIPSGLSNYPIIPASIDVTVNNITIASGASLSIEKASTLSVSGNFTNTGGTVTLNSDSDEFSSLLVSGTTSGDITYNRYVNSVSAGWDLIGSPVSGLPFSTFILNANIATNVGFYAVGSYDNTTDTWTNATSATTGNLQLGQGYQMATTSGGTLSFTGAIANGDQSVIIKNNDAVNSGAGKRWNLIANPFASYLKANSNANTINNFLTVNTSAIDDTFEAIYGWNSTGYTIYNNTSTATYIAPGQGFFVAAAGSGEDQTISFTKAMQTIAGTDDFIASKTSAASYDLVLEIHQDTKKLGDTKFYFKEGLTLGLDPGYDAGAFNQGSALSSRLLAQDNGINMGINAMSIDHMASVVVPLVVNQEAGNPFAIRIANHTLPSDINVYVEDVVEKTLTLVTAKTFTLTPQTKLSGIGRFYLHFTRSSLSIESIAYTSLISAYKGNGNDYISIEGLQQFSKPSQIILYNLLGMKIIDKTINTPSQKETITTVGIKEGVYIFQINYDNKVLTKKIVID
jgi:hypothetical protein